MIISVDPTNTEDIATFALVKQYRLVPLSTTLATTAWTADATNGGYTLTQNVSDTGILIYTDPSVVVAFNASVEDTTSAPAGQDANVIATEIQADATNTSYIVTFHADTIPVANVVVNLLIYGTTIPGQSSGEDPATAEEITAAVLQNLDGRVSALETAIPNKVDKRTGAGQYAYTHDGNTQGETSIVDGTTANSIGIRDANGRMQAADPASGATDKTLVTANWVSQTGDSAPNNLIHKSGNETKSGTMTFDDPVYGRLIKPLYENYSGAMPNGKYRIFAKIPAAMTNTMAYLDVMTSANGFNFAFGILLVGNPTSTSWICRWALRKDNGGFLTANAIQIAKDTATGDLLVFAKNPTYTGLSISLRYAKSGSSIHGADRIVAYYDAVDYALDGTDAGITDIVAGVDI